MAAAPWILLMPSVPARPAYARVKVWRRLQGAGAVALKNGVWAMPRRDECVEAFAWIAREIVDLGGQASVCEGRFVDGATDAEIERRFADARAEDYRAVSDDARAVLRALKPKKVADAKLDEADAHAKRLRARLAEIDVIDFFSATGREAALGLVGAIEAAVAERRGAGAGRDALAPMRPPRAARWVTRRGVHVDRIACAWLVRRFVDPDAKLAFVDPKTYVRRRGDVRYDMFDAELTHVGDRCSFEVIVERMGLASDAALVALGEIVHDVDLRDGKFGREETAGVRSAIAGVCLSVRDDVGRVAAATPMLDALYSWFARPRATKGGAT